MCWIIEVYENSRGTAETPVEIDDSPDMLISNLANATETRKKEKGKGKARASKHSQAASGKARS